MEQSYGKSGGRIAARKRMKNCEIVADNLSKAGWSLGWVAALDVPGRTIWIVEAYGYGKRFIVRAEEKLTTFLQLQRAKDRETIADNLSKSGWSWGYVSALDLQGRIIWIVDKHGYGNRFIVRADEKLTAFLELERPVVSTC